MPSPGIPERSDGQLGNDPIRSNLPGGATTADYSGLPGSITFESGETTTVFGMQATADTDNENGEGVRIDFGTLPDEVILDTRGQHC